MPVSSSRMRFRCTCPTQKLFSSSRRVVWCIIQSGRQKFVISDTPSVSQIDWKITDNYTFLAYYYAVARPPWFWLLFFLETRERSAAKNKNGLQSLSDNVSLWWWKWRLKHENFDEVFSQKLFRTSLRTIWFFSKNYNFCLTFGRKKGRLTQGLFSNFYVSSMWHTTRILNPKFIFCNLPENFTGQRKNECENTFFEH